MHESRNFDKSYIAEHCIVCWRTGRGRRLPPRVLGVEGDFPTLLRRRRPPPPPSDVALSCCLNPGRWVGQ